MKLSSENINQQSINDDINQVNNQYHEELLKNQQAENIVENTSMMMKFLLLKKLFMKTKDF